MKGTTLPYEDPFAAAPADTEAPAEVQEEPKTVVVKTAAVGAGEGKIVLTYKEGAGYDASWTVVHAESVADANAILADPSFKELLERSKKVAAFFRDKPAAPAQQASQPANGAAPQGAQSAPGGETRFCSHGAMVFKSGVAKATGKPYSLFSCTAPRESQCKAEFLK